MKKLFLSLFIVAAFAAAPVIAARTGGGAVYAAADNTAVYQSFAGYDTLTARKYNMYDNAIIQMKAWTTLVTATVISVPGFAPNSAGALEIGVGDNESGGPFYSNGSKTNYNQTGGKYVKWYIENTSGFDADFGVIITDLPQ